MDIESAVIVITGASSGIGRATALAAADKKAHLVLASREDNVLAEVAEECRRRGARAISVQTDVSQEEQVQTLTREAIEAFGRIDVWLNGAAVGMLAAFEDAPPDVFRQVMETNFFGYVYGARAALPHIRRQGSGMIINIASELGKFGAPYATAYSASKFAVAGFSESLRLELLDEPDIHVCTVFPAAIDTPFFQHAANYTGRSVQAPPPVFKPEKVAASILSCIEKPRREVYVGDVRRKVALHGIAQPLAERMIATKVDRKHFGDEPAEATSGSLFKTIPGSHDIHGGWSRSNGNRRKVALLTLVASGVAGAAAYYLYQRKSSAGPLRRMRKRVACALP